MKFNVTFETVTPDSAEYGDFSDSGFALENCTLREAVDYMCCEGGIEADRYPLNNPRWITAYKADECYETGAETNYSLHFPESMTNSSRMRVCRLLEVYGA